MHFAENKEFLLETISILRIITVNFKNVNRLLGAGQNVVQIFVINRYSTERTIYRRFNTF